MAQQKYCYAIINNDDNSFLIEDRKLPIYWNKKVAQKAAGNHKEFRVEKCLFKELHKFILTYPV